jgi:hypothetical protein
MAGGDLRPAEELLTFGGGSEHDPKVEAWFYNTSDPLRFAAREWWGRIRGCGDDVLELFHDGCPVALVQDAPFAYVNAFSAHASVGFHRGAFLPDPTGLLEGAGVRMRHIKLRPGEQVDVDALNALIDAAYHDIRERIGAM